MKKENPTAFFDQTIQTRHQKGGQNSIILLRSVNIRPWSVRFHRATSRIYRKKTTPSRTAVRGCRVLNERISERIRGRIRGQTTFPCLEKVVCPLILSKGGLSPNSIHDLRNRGSRKLVLSGQVFKYNIPNQNHRPDQGVESVRLRQFRPRMF